MFTFLTIVALCLSGIYAQFLEVSGNDFMYNGEKVFLSGMNIAWELFGYDFGNGQYECCTGDALEEHLRNIAAAGGNSVRIWIHTDGRDTPNFDTNGFVLSPDRTGSFISDLSRYLDVAQENNILVTLVLWNGATMPLLQVRDLMWDDAKLDSYINNALIPMVDALKDKRALAAWEVINEPEGSLNNMTADPNPCFDGIQLQGTGAGWSGAFVPPYNMLRFISRQNAAIKGADPKALTTIGSWSERAQTDNFGYTNFYKDSCLAAAGESTGTIEFYQMHTYENGGSYSATSPMVVNNDVYGIGDKPNVIGEYSQDGGDGRDITVLHTWSYEEGYDGGWTWHANAQGEHSDDFATQARALEAIRGRTDNGKIELDLS